MKAIFQKELEFFEWQTYSERPLYNLHELEQTHSIIINNLTDNCPADGISLKIEELSQTTPLIITADCLPIVFYNHKAIIFIHAGWKGLSDGIIQNNKIKELKPAKAFIGPCISVENFEVQADFHQNFPNSSSFISINQKTFFDLTKEAISQIKNIFPKCEIETSNICTFEDNRFHSYRRNKTTKRNWHILMPKKEKNE